MRQRCRHCKRRHACRPRRLCTKCYDRPRVRLRYPLEHAKNERSALRVRRSDKAPPPTQAWPGSAEKIAVLTRRTELGQELFHPDDASFADWPLAKVG